MYSDGVGHGCPSTLEIPIIRSPSSPKNEVPFICSSASEREKEENECGRSDNGAVEEYRKKRTESQVGVEKEGKIMGKGKGVEDRVLKLQSLSSATCPSPGSNMNPVMATEVEMKEQSVDRASIEVVRSSSRASDDCSCYNLPLATKIKKQLNL